MTRSLNAQKNMLVWSFLAIPVLLSLMFIVYPVVDLVRTSFTSWNGASAVRTPVGFANYVQVFTRSPAVWISLRNNALYFVAHLIVIPLQLLVAVVLNNKRIRGRTFFKVVTFMPYIINGVAISYMFSYFFSPVNGALNGLLKSMGMDWAILKWFSDKNVVNFTLVFVSVWRYFGFGVVLYFAALQSIPKDIIEASQIDGANVLHTFRHIIAPSVARITQVLVFLNIRGGLQVFDIPFVMTGGGPNDASSTFTLYTINTAFKFQSYGLASAMAVVLMVMIVSFTFVQQKAFGEGGKL